MNNMIYLIQVHLETEQEETREKEREKTRLRMIERQKKERKKEENMLFGNQSKVFYMYFYFVSFSQIDLT